MKSLFKKWAQYSTLLLFSVALLIPTLSTPHVSAAGSFSYKDSTKNQITGPLDGQNGRIITFDHQTDMLYQGTFSGRIYRITLDSAKGSTGTLLDVGTNQTTNITIDTPAVPGGGAGGAAYSGEWITHSQILVNGKTYIDSKVDDNLDFRIKGTDDPCEAKNYINGFNHQGADSRNARENADIHIFSVPGNGNINCVEKLVSISFTHPEMYDYYFVWVDSGTIATSDYTSIIFKASEGANIFYGDSSCQSQITADPGAGGSLILRNDKLNQGWPGNIGNPSLHSDGGGCNISNAISVGIVNPVTADGKHASELPPNTGLLVGNNQTTTEQEVSCESSNDSGLEFVFCPIIRGIDKMLNAINSQVKDIMEINTAVYEQDSGTHLKEAWGNIRNIASILLVLFALIMVISTAINVGPFDAYTIRKILPRLVAAIIVMQLSWSLMILMIQIVNDIGRGVTYIMLSPFGGAEATGLGSVLAQSQAGQGSALISFNAVTIGLAGGAALGLGVLGILSLAFTTILGVIIGFAVLLLRNIVIIAALVIAPFAIVSYILPGTEKLGKFWWDAFSKGLLMFPIIMVLFASGRIFSYVAANSGDASNGTFGNLLQFIIVIAAYVIPYFLIPATFKLAGGAVATLGGMVNDRSRGIFDRNKKFRAGQTSKNVGKMKTGDRFQNRNMLTRGFNRATFGASTGRRGHFGFGDAGRTAMDLRRRAAAKQAVKENPLLQELAYDDNAVAVMALSGGTRQGAEAAALRLQAANGWTDEQRDRAVATAHNIGFNNSNAAGAFDLMAQNKSRALAGVLAGEGGMDLVRQSATQIAGNNEQLVDNLMGSFAYHSRNAGRLDLGGERQGESMLQGWQRASTGQHAQSYGESMQAFADAAVTTMSNPASTADERSAAALVLMEMQNMLPNSTAGNQESINTALADVGVDHNATRVERVMQPDGSMADVQVRMSVEEQLANIASGLPPQFYNAAGTTPRVITASEIRGRARVYDGNVPIEGRNQQVPPTPGTP